MTLPPVVMCSLWRNDVARGLSARVQHLLAKAESYPNVRYVWVVGDSRDNTSYALAELSHGSNVQIVDIGDTGIEGEDVPTRLRRLSETGNEWWNWCENATYIMIHESDLISPPDLVNRMVANAERGICPVAAWPIINMNGETWCYDIWALRKDGVRFTNRAPYHKCYHPNNPFVVDSFGSVYLFHGEDVPLVHFENHAVLDLCQQLREQGRTLWVDPQIVVEQPVALWQFHLIDEHA